MRSTLVAALLGVLGVILAGCAQTDGSRLVDSAPGSPTLLSRSPMPGAQNVAVGEPIIAVASERLDPARLRNSSVIVTGEDGAVLGKLLSLSADGRTLTAELISKPEVPNTLTVTLTPEITDGAGNSLIVPDEPWSFELPEWLTLGEALSAADGSNTWSALPDLAASGAAGLLAGWVEADGITYNGYVSRWDGSAWQPVGDGVLSALESPETFVGEISLAVDAAGDLAVAWSEWSGDARDLFVERWDGSEWTPVGTQPLSAADGAGTSVQDASLVLDAAGNPIVAWSELDGPVIFVHVWRWDGAAWGALGDPLSVATGSSEEMGPSLAIGPDGEMLVAWREFDGTALSIHVRRWDGIDWTPVEPILSAFAGAGTDASLPALSLTPAGDPVVAWYEADGAGANYLNVMRFEEGIWRSFDRIPVDLLISGMAPALALDGANDPVVAFVDADSGHDFVHVRRWEEYRWVEAGGRQNADHQAPRTPPAMILLGELDTPVVAWQLEEGDDDVIFVRRYNR